MLRFLPYTAINQTENPSFITKLSVIKCETPSDTHVMMIYLCYTDTNDNYVRIYDIERWSGSDNLFVLF